MKFISILDEDLVLDGLTGDNRETLYRQMLTNLAEYTEQDWDISGMLAEIMEREDSVDMPYDGVALPHLRRPGLDDLYIVVGIPSRQVKIKKHDKSDCGVIFMSLISKNTSDVYLNAIAALARHIATPERLTALLAAARGGKTALWHYLHEQDIRMNKVVTAEDVMTPAPEPLSPEATLAQAFDRFNATHCMELPIADSEGRLIGRLSAIEVIKDFIPDYVFMMKSLNFLNDFEVFNRIFHSEHRQPVKRYMLPAGATVSPATPLIQFTIRLARRETELFYVTDDAGKLLGRIGVDNLIHKVLRG